MSNAKGALIYCRVSTRKQEEEGTSLESQEQESIRFAEAKGIPVLLTFSEVYTATELWNRPLLSRVRREIKSGKYSHLIVHAVDRLSRNAAHLLIIAEECDRAGVELSFVTEQLDNTPNGQLIRYVRGFAAQVELEKRRERTIRGKHAIAVRGKIHNSGSDLYGYRRDRDARVRLIYEPEAAIVRQIFNQIIGGSSIRGVTRWLNTEGIPVPSTGKRAYRDSRTPRWGKSSVTRILKEPSYKGQATGWRWKSEKVKGKQKIVQRPVEEQIPLPEGVTPAIVTPEVWSAAQKSNGGVKTRNEQRRYLLRGRIYCFNCGELCYSETSKGRRYYCCSSRQKIDGPCGVKMIPASYIEGAVWSQLEDMIKDPETIRLGLLATQDESEQSKLKAELKAVKKELSKSEAGLQRLISKFRFTDNAILLKAIDADTNTAQKEISIT